MIRVGITGGIGSGKTTFCKEWEQEGAYVLYADDLAKELMVTDPELKEDIIQTFGENSYDENGALNRAYLAQEAFEKGRVDDLNALVHPVLWERTDELARSKEEEGIKIFAYEAAVLLNKGRPDNLDYVILIQAPEEARVQRTLQRDGTDEDKVRERITNQPDFDQLLHLTDFVVQNDGDLHTLKQKARQLYKKIYDWAD